MTWRRSIGWLLAGLVLGAFGAAAMAASWPSGMVLRYSTNGTPVWAAAAVSGSPSVGTAGSAVLNAGQSLNIGGVKIPVALSRPVTASNVATMGRIASRLLGPIALVGLAYEGISWVAGQWTVPAVDTAPVPGWMWSAPSGAGLSTCGPDAPCSWAALLAAMTAACVAQPGGPYDCSEVGVYAQWEGHTYTVDMAMKLNGNYSGYSFNKTVEKTGTPYSGGSGGVATDGQVESSILAGLQADPSKAPLVLGYAMNDPVAAAALAPGAVAASGAASAPGGSRTATEVGTAGTTTTVVDTTYNITYAGDVVTVTATENSTVTYPNATTTTTTTTTNPPGGGGSEPTEEVPNLCEENPDAAGCVPLGPAPDSVELEEDERTISNVVSEKTAAGSCPAPISLSFMGKPFEFSYGSICSLAEGVRPLVLAIAWLGAISFVYGVASKKT